MKNISTKFFYVNECSSFITPELFDRRPSVTTIIRISSQVQEDLGEDVSQRWYYGGKRLSERTRVGQCGVPGSCVIQCCLAEVGVSNVNLALT